MKKLFSFAAVIILSTVLIVPAFSQGQDQQDMQGQDKQGMEQQETQGQQQGTQGQQQGTQGQQQGQNVIKAEQILDNSVVDSTGAQIGKVANLLINKQTGEVQAIAVQVEETYRLVPMQQILQINEKQIMTSVAKDEVTKAPSVKKLDKIDKKWIEESYKHYGVPYQDVDWVWILI